MVKLESSVCGQKAEDWQALGKRPRRGTRVFLFGLGLNGIGSEAPIVCFRCSFW